MKNLLKCNLLKFLKYSRNFCAKLWLILWWFFLINPMNFHMPFVNKIWKRNPFPHRGGHRDDRRITGWEKIRCVNVAVDEGFPQKLFFSPIGLISIASQPTRHRGKYSGDKTKRQKITAAVQRGKNLRIWVTYMRRSEWIPLKKCQLTFYRNSYKRRRTTNLSYAEINVVEYLVVEKWFSPSLFSTSYSKFFNSFKIVFRVKYKKTAIFIL